MSEETRKRTVKHAFLRVGEVYFQIGEPQDGKLYVGKDDINTWPHWAFEVSGEDLLSNVERLRGLGIPVFGPVTHPGADGFFAYFTAPEGQKLEFTTWDAIPGDKVYGQVGAPGVGPIPWADLGHDWPNTAS
jgi:hypothetical protein